MCEKRAGRRAGTRRGYGGFIHRPPGSQRIIGDRDEFLLYRIAHTEPLTVEDTLYAALRSIP